MPDITFVIAQYFYFKHWSISSVAFFFPESEVLAVGITNLKPQGVQSLGLPKCKTSNEMINIKKKIEKKL